MENNKRLNYIQEQIGYKFKRSELLRQAFTRRSYSEENKGFLNNEVLEFYGDKALDLIVTKKMSEYFGNITENDRFYSCKNEGELTDIKKKLVCREMLASRIRAIFGDHNPMYLWMGKGDIEQKVWEQDSVQEDLFEAIIGAVAIDSNWNIEMLTNVVDLMLNPEFYFKNGFDNGRNYVDLLQQWCQKKYRRLPVYHFQMGCSNDKLLYDEYDGGTYQCNLAIFPFNCFQALGKTKSSAKMAAAKKAYEYLEQHHLLISLVDEVGKPDFDRAVNQLQELYQKGYIKEPKYIFSETFDKDGNPVWDCECHVQGLDIIYSQKCSSKKQGKKMVAYEMVKLYLHWEETNETT